MWWSKLAFLFLLSKVGASADTTEQQSNKLCESPELYDSHPILCHYLDRLCEDSDKLAAEITQWASDQGLLVGSNLDFSSHKQVLEASDSGLPIVFAHGMGDSCFNSGFQNLVKETSSILNNVHSVCIPTGKNHQEDTTNGYFLNMDASVDVFAAAIQADPKLANGFHAIGLSQGNNVIRGYIARYNEPAVDTFLSINGVNAGTGAVPNCFPSKDGLTTRSGGFCDLINEQASKRAYTEFSQEHSFQANYWRDPRPEEREAYQKYSQLARWNNEGFIKNQTLKDNFAKTKKFVWVMATKDEMVWPKEGEQWCSPDPSAPYERILPRNETEWYQKDLFGLKSAEEEGKNHYVTFEGNHLQFNMDEYTDWINTYLVDDKSEVTTSIQ